MRGLLKGLGLAWLALAGAAQAQKIYAARGPGSNLVVGGGVSLFADPYGQTKVAGLWTYAALNATWRYGVEGEARSLKYHTQEGVTQSDYLVGPRVYLRGGNVRPYGKVMIGMGRMTFPFGYGTGSYLAYAGGGGVDWLVGDRLIVRVMDAEYQDWPQFTFGKLAPYGVSAGVSWRVNGMKRIPPR